MAGVARLVALNFIRWAIADMVVKLRKTSGGEPEREGVEHGKG